MNLMVGSFASSKGSEKRASALFSNQISKGANAATTGTASGPRMQAQSARFLLNATYGRSTKGQPREGLYALLLDIDATYLAKHDDIPVPQAIAKSRYQDFIVKPCLV